MKRNLSPVFRVISWFLVLELSLLSPLRLYANSPLADVAVTDDLYKGVDTETLKQDLNIAYWNKLDHENPWLTEFALGEPLTPNDEPLWRVDPNSPLLDEDPFFLRSQKWEADARALQSCEDYCFSKNEDGTLNVHREGSPRRLVLPENFQVLLETDQWIFFKSLDNEIFQAKITEETDEAQGVFFLNKKDFEPMALNKNPLPVFHFPLPGKGWVGEKVIASDMTSFGQIAIESTDGYVIPVDVEDIVKVERLSRRNFVWTQAISLITDNLQASGIALPLPKTTMAFGLMLSGLPDLKGGQRDFGLKNNFEKLIEFLAIPKAHAQETDSSVKIPETRREQLRQLMDARLEQMQAEGKNFVEVNDGSKPAEKSSTLSRWAPSTLMYGGTAAAAVLAAQHIDFKDLVVEDISTRIAIVLGIFAVTAVAAVIMKYTLHRDHFEKLYPKEIKTNFDVYERLSRQHPRFEGESFLEHVQRLEKAYPREEILPRIQESLATRIHREHKGIVTEYVHGLYFGAAGPGQAIRHTLDYLKDRFVSRNKMVATAWEATMGFQIRQSSRLPVNWKTFYLGSFVMGMSDSMLVAVDLLIFTPFLMQYFEMGAAMGAVAAAFASSEVLRNFIGYLQGGAHDYAATVKMIHMKKAEREANRILRSQGKDPELPKYGKEKKDLINNELQRTYTGVGLPGANEFLYDPITALEASVAKGGFSLDRLRELPAAEKEKLAQMDFLFSHRYWGKVIPALSDAIKAAESAYAENPTDEGKRVVETLKWAQQYRGFFTPSAIGDSVQKLGGLATSEDYRKSLQSFVSTEIEEVLKTYGKIGMFGTLRAGVAGTFKYLRQSEIDKVRDIRLVLFLMSTTGSYREVVDYLPKSWIEQAGGRAAGQAAAELFHRGLLGIQQHKNVGLRPSVEVLENYGERANKVLDYLATKDTSLQDPFLREVRFWEISQRIADTDRERFDVRNFQPEKLSPVERRQWAKARAQAQPVLDTMSGDFEIGRKWLEAGQQFFQLTNGEKASAEEMRAWIENYQRKMVLTSAFARNIGFYVADMEKSEILDRVVIAAANETAEELKLKGNEFYMANLTPAEKEFYEARIFYNHFLSNYMKFSVQSENMNALSPEFPGRFQGARIRFAGKRWATPILFFTRVGESVFQNDAEAYLPGLKASVNRTLPFVADLYQNFMRDLRVMPYALSIAYVTTYYIWQVHMPYSMWVFMLVFSFTHPVMVEMNNRLMRFFNIRPMNDVPSKLTYSFIHSRLTNPIVMLQLAFAGTIAAFLTSKAIAGGFVIIGTVAVSKLAWDQWQEKRKNRNVMESTRVRDGRMEWLEGKAPVIETGSSSGPALRCVQIFKAG